MPVNLLGFEQFAAKIKALPKVLLAEVNNEIKDAGRSWEQGAKRMAPKDQGRLYGEIHATSTRPLTTEIVVNIDYAPYVEWGTKSKVRVPSDIADYAAQFKGKGTAGSARKFIYAWCKRKGIPEEAWFAIYRSIMINGIRPHPFFFVQRPRVEKELIQHIKTILNTEH